MELSELMLVCQPQVWLQRHYWLHVLQPRCDEATWAVGFVWYQVVSGKPHCWLSKPADSVRPHAVVRRVWNVRVYRFVRQRLRLYTIVVMNVLLAAELYSLETHLSFSFQNKLSSQWAMTLSWCKLGWGHIEGIFWGCVPREMCVVCSRGGNVRGELSGAHG